MRLPHKQKLSHAAFLICQHPTTRHLLPLPTPNHPTWHKKCKHPNDNPNQRTGMPQQANLYEILASWQRNRRQHFTDRTILELWQRRMLTRLFKEALPQSPYYQPYLKEAIENWPVMNPVDLTRHFDQINTIGARHEDVFALGVRADIARDYACFARDYTPLLSAGSKGRRRACILSHEERVDRIGAILARLYPEALPEGTSIAWYFRSNNAPYFTLKTETLELQSYDLQEHPSCLVQKLQHQQPHLIIAPASALLRILTLIMDGRLELERCERIYNSGEVMTARDRLALRRQFATVGDIYQGVEGMLGITCAHGRLHLCEEKYLIEKEWLDDSHYIPLITSFTAHALPLVRYRMDDVLQHDPHPCPCGNCADSVRVIEGRTDDIFILPSPSIIRRIKIYPHTSHHTLARLLSWKNNYRLSQHSPTGITLAADTDGDTLQECRAHLQLAWQKLGVDTSQLRWRLVDRLPATSPCYEQRSIRRLPLAVKAF